MATGAAPQLAATGGQNEVFNLLNLVKGTSSTTSSNVSNQGITELVNQILRGSQGLGAISGAQKNAGMYGSTVNQQMINDLITQTAAKTEAARVGSTTKSPAKFGGGDIVNILGMMAAAKVLGPSVTGGVKKLGLDKAGESLASLLGLGSSAPAAEAIGASAPSFTFGTELAGITAGATSGAAGVGTAEVAGAASGTGIGTGTGEAALGAGAAVGAADIYAAGMGTAEAGTAAAGWSAGITEGVGYTAAGVGGTAAAGTAGTAAAVAEGATVAEGVAVAAEGAGFWETIATAAAASWIVCTELNRQRRMPNRFYIHGAKEFAKYDERGKQGYYIWAIPSVQHLRKYPNSWYSNLLEKVFNSRAEYLAAIAGCRGARKTVAGFAITHGLYGFCWILSRTIARKPQDWTVVYAKQGA